MYSAQTRINDRYPGFLDQKRYITPQPRECHNDYVEHLVEYGLIGFSIFMLFVIFVVQKGMNTLVSASGNDFFLILLLISALVSILINAFFFFGLRIPSTAMMFWMISAIIVSFQGNHFQSFVPRWWLTGAVIVLGIGFVWECIGKRVFANRYFILFMRSQKRAMRYLNRALDFAPYDSILRTHASMSWADHDITMSRNHAQKLLHFFDGQTPLWASLFNVGLAVARGAKDALEEANLYMKTSHYVLPYFKPTLEILNGRESVSIRTKYKGGSAIMKIVNGETAWRIRALLEKKGSCERDLALLQAEVDKISLKKETVNHQIALCESNVENAILLEKKRLNIPDSWIYDPEKAEFRDPQSLPPEERKRLGGE